MVDFLEALKKEEWDLHEFVCYINNEEPYEGNTSIDPTDTSPTANYVKKYMYGSRTYHIANRIACSPINEDLTPQRVEDNKSDGALNFFFKPRVLLEWADNVGIDITYNLQKYLNYSYWIERDAWTFDEIVTLLYSKNCPFPHEIINNTLESLDEVVYNIASRLRDSINQKYNDTDGILGCYAFAVFGSHPKEYEIYKLYALEWADNSGIAIPEAMRYLIKGDAGEAYDNQYLNDIAKQNDYINWLGLPSCTIREGTSILLGLRIHMRDGQFNRSLHDSELKELLKRAIIAKDIEILESQNTGDYFDDHVKPKRFLQWAIDAGAREIPKGLLKLYNINNTTESDTQKGRKTANKQIIAEAERLANEGKLPEDWEDAKKHLMDWANLNFANIYSCIESVANIYLKKIHIKNVESQKMLALN